jgi:hypothetical protein
MLVATSPYEVIAAGILFCAQITDRAQSATHRRCRDRVSGRALQGRLQSYVPRPAVGVSISGLRTCLSTKKGVGLLPALL